jgi:uncharacterized cupin superfamily protein
LTLKLLCTSKEAREDTSVDTATLHDKIEQTVKSGKPKMYFDLLGTENMRCWLNVYMPGEGTAGLHYHHSDETFTVIEGSGEIVHRGR